MGDSRTSRLRIAFLTGASGLAIETVDGAVIEDVSVTNHHDARCVSERRFFMRLGARMRGPAGVSVGSITASDSEQYYLFERANSSGRSRICSILSGIPGHPIEDVKFTDIMIAHVGGGTKDDAERRLAENEKDYPEPNMFGATPSHGFFIRHVRGVEMNGIKIEHSNPDARPRLCWRMWRGRISAGSRRPGMAGVPTFC